MLGLRLSTLSNTKRQALKALIKGKNLTVTRAALAANPVQLFNPTVSNLPTVFNNNVEATHGGWGFIGGDTITVEIDGSTKVAGSTVECPVRVLTTNNPVLQTPSSITGTYFESSQTELDRMKVQDGSVSIAANSVNGNYAQLMLEIDLTSLANSLYGGSNSALKSALKSIQIDNFAKGNGSNGGVATDGVIATYYANNGTSAYTGWCINDTGRFGALGSSTTNVQNTTASIADCQIKLTSSDITWGSPVDSNNKLYVLIVSKYASNGTIASSVSLDYFKLTLGLNRTVDTVTPSTVNLPKNWVALVKFSPMWDSTRADRALEILQLENTDSNKYELFFQNGRFYFGKNINGSWQSIYTTTQTFSKGTVHSIAIAMAKDGMYLFVLKNNGTMEKVFIGYTTRYVGTVNVRCLHGLTGNQGDGFADQFALYDLDAMGGIPTDALMANILQCVQPNPLGITLSELFDINQVSLHANATKNGNTITLNATGASQISSVDVPVLPNNRYEFKTSVVTNGGSWVLLAQEFMGNTFIGNNMDIRSVNADSVITLTTNSKTNKVKLMFYNTTSGVFTFSNISFKLKQ